MVTKIIEIRKIKEVGHIKVKKKKIVSFNKKRNYRFKRKIYKSLKKNNQLRSITTHFRNCYQSYLFGLK